MNEDRFVISTRKSLYDPIEIEIDGEVYQSKKTTRTILAEINELDKKISPDNDEPLYKIVRLLFDVDQKILDKLDKREVEDIYFFVKKKFQEIERERLRLISDTFGKIWNEKGQRVKRTIPKNRKRPGNKA
ncbi:MAG: hypothetical protein ACTSPV_00675 [Candidatus Hodarchaeales archaeon]